MKLSGKVVSILVVFLVFFNFVIYRIILRDYKELNKFRLDMDLERIENTYQYEQKNLEKTAMDWAVWDDSYEFVENENKKYIDSNLNETAFTTLDVEYIVYFNLERKVVYSGYLNNESGELVDVPKEILEKIKKLEPGSGVVLNDEGKLLMVAIEEIRDSEYEKEANGFLFMGYELTKDRILKEFDNLNIPLEIDSNFSENAVGIKNDIKGTVYFKSLDGSNISLKVSAKKELYDKVKRHSVQLFLLISGAFTLSVFSVKYTIRNLVLSKIEKFSRDVVQIAEKEDFDKKLVWKEKDEIGDLKDAINNLVARINMERKNYQTLYDGTSAINLVMDENMIIRHVSKTFQDLLGYSENEVLGKIVLDFLPDKKDKNKLVRFYKKFLKNWRFNNFEMDLTRKDGKILNILVTMSKINLSKSYEKNVLFTGIDITEIKSLKKQVNKFFRHDKLTQAYNRESGLNMLKGMLRTSKRKEIPLTVAVFDISKLKSVNDNYGQSQGDRLIKDFVQIIRDNISNSDLLCRLGGGEFLTAFLKADSKKAGAVIGRIIKDVEKFNDAKNRRYEISFCKGYVEYDHNMDLNQLLEVAESRLQVDKKSYIKINSDKELLEDLKTAIAQKQFLVYYQPKINIENENHTELEALVRWEHPKLGILGPNHFIPIAEKYELMEEIGNIVLETSCKDMLELKKLFDVSLAVNISPLQFRSDKFVREIKSFIMERRNECSLELEITESVAMENVEDSINKMKELIEFGVTFTIDDFGTGYSSLGYLKKFPINRIKIDKSFILGMIEDNDKMVIVRTIIELAKEMNLDIVAEGVETDEQLKILLGMGCKVFQGFLFGKPVPKKVLSEKIKNNEYIKKLKEALEVNKL